MPRAANNPDPRRAYQCGRILVALEVEALTSQQLGDKLHLSRSGIQKYLQEMMAERPRLVHISGFEPNPDGHKAAPKYALGDKEDAAHERSRAPKGRVTAEDQYKKILRKLRIRPMTAAEVVKEMLLQRARIYVFEMHAAGRIYISGWKQDATGAWRSPVYEAGTGQDVPRPGPQSQREKGARAWQKLKADPHRHGLLLQRNRMRKNPQTWFSALM